ncbi:MAG: PilZ domain-containing protein, partial [Myxococcales bacterium]|nr:PilZ domain-containing protein [Myxococcales bacterium]
MDRQPHSGRIQPRAEVLLAAHYGSLQSSGSVDSVCLNLSRSGMFLQTAEPPRVGSLVLADCEVPGVERHVRGMTQVVWRRVKQQGERRPQGMGLRFVRLETGSQALIDELLASALPELEPYTELELEEPETLFERVAEDEEDLITGAQLEAIPVDEPETPGNVATPTAPPASAES